MGTATRTTAMRVSGEECVGYGREASPYSLSKRSTTPENLIVFTFFLRNCGFRYLFRADCSNSVKFVCLRMFARTYLVNHTMNLCPVTRLGTSVQAPADLPTTATLQE